MGMPDGKGKCLPLCVVSTILQIANVASCFYGCWTIHIHRQVAAKLGLQKDTQSILYCCCCGENCNFSCEDICTLCFPLCRLCQIAREVHDYKYAGANKTMNTCQGCDFTMTLDAPETAKPWSDPDEALHQDEAPVTTQPGHGVYTMDSL